MSHKRYRILAECLDKKGRVLSRGYNSYTKSHPLQKHFAVLAEGNDLKTCLHAEIAAILRARDEEIHSIFVQRIEGDKYGLAKPCPTCSLAIKTFGIKVVRYTTAEGIEEYEN